MANQKLNYLLVYFIFLLLFFYILYLLFSIQEITSYEFIKNNRNYL